MKSWLFHNQGALFHGLLYTPHITNGVGNLIPNNILTLNKKTHVFFVKNGSSNLFRRSSSLKQLRMTEVEIFTESTAEQDSRPMIWLQKNASFLGVEWPGAATGKKNTGHWTAWPWKFPKKWTLALLGIAVLKLSTRSLFLKVFFKYTDILYTSPVGGKVYECFQLVNYHNIRNAQKHERNPSWGMKPSKTHYFRQKKWIDKPPSCFPIKKCIKWHFEAFHNNSKGVNL